MTRTQLPVLMAALLAGQIARFYFRAGIVVDTFIVLIGLILLGVTAWMSEWRDRVQTPG